MVNDRNFIHKFDPNVSDFENWKDGNDLHFARFYGALPETREQYRNLKIPSPNWVEVEMGFEVADRLKSGELNAFGIISYPEPKDHPERIPTTLFFATDIDIDWDKSEVKGLNRTYVSVKICEASDGQSEPNIEASPVVRGGRPSTYDKSKVVLDELYQIESNRGKKAQKLHSDFVKAFERRFPLNEYQVPAPCDRTLRGHIKKYWQELEETGKK